MVLLREGFTDRPVLDMALSHALLLRVAEGARPAAVRIYEPGPTVAFSKLDTHAPGFAAACDAARSHGYEPVIRLGGGHAAAYGPGCLIHEEIVPHAPSLEGLHERYVQATTLARRRCWGLGVPVAAGALEGEYCAGAHSLHAGGVKVAGIAQRVVKGAALTAPPCSSTPARRSARCSSTSTARSGSSGGPRPPARSPTWRPRPRSPRSPSELAPDALAPGGLEPEDRRRAIELEPAHRA